jgi:hypothetical protein
MNKRQEQHLDDILQYLVVHLSAKYTAGAREHKGTLLDMSPLELIDNAIDEALDQITYLVSLRMKVTK